MESSFSKLCLNKRPWFQTISATPFGDELDNIVTDHGGRLYLAKDVRMSKRVFRKGYPKWQQFTELREKRGMKQKFNSLQSTRLGI